MQPLGPRGKANQCDTQRRGSQSGSLISGRDAQAIFCRRRHQPRRPPPAKIRPVSPAPTTVVAQTVGDLMITKEDRASANGWKLMGRIFAQKVQENHKTLLLKITRLVSPKSITKAETVSPEK